MLSKISCLELKPVSSSGGKFQKLESLSRNGKDLGVLEWKSRLLVTYNTTTLPLIFLVMKGKERGVYGREIGAFEQDKTSELNLSVKKLLQ